MNGNREGEYLQLMDLYVRVVESMAGVPSVGDNAWIKDAENLSIKLFYHLGSLFYLTKGTKLPRLGGVEVEYIDNSTINVVARSAFETYLAFYYIFVAPTSNSEKIFRLKVWELGGLLDRQKFPASLEESKDKLREEKKRIELLVKDIQNNPIYKKQDTKRQKEAKKGKWRFQNTWGDLAEVACFNRSYFDSLYRYLSGYAHSGSLSSIQIEASAANRNSQLELAKTILGVGKVLMGHFIFSFVSIFSKANTVLGAYPDAAAIAEIWNGIGRDW